MADKPIEKTVIIKILNEEIKTYERLIGNVKRKRSWRPSEKAMTTVHYMERINGFKEAIRLIQGVE